MVRQLPAVVHTVQEVLPLADHPFTPATVLPLATPSVDSCPPLVTSFSVSWTEVLYQGLSS